MANLQKKNKNLNSVSVKIRKNGHPHIYKTFSDEETAKLYARYKEDIMNDMSKFDAPHGDIITLGSAIELKINKLKEEKRDGKTISDTQQLIKEFHDWIDLPISEISYQMMKDRANIMLTNTVRRGGNAKNQTGKAVVQSPVTVRKKFAYLSGVISLLTEMGLDIENRAYRLLGFLTKVSEV